MKIAVLSDIHGNYIALREVLNEAKRLNVEHLFILGDVVGYYYHPDKVLELLEPWSKDMIQGNHEVMMKKAMADLKDAEMIRKKYGHGIDFAIKNLSKEWIKKLVELPFNKIITLDGVKFQLCHGAPWDHNEYIYANSPEELLTRCISSDFDYVLIGHSHYAFFYKKNNTILINSGSVGQSREEGGLASWAIIDTLDRSFELKTTKYDVAEIIDEVKRIDPQIEYLHQVILRPRRRILNEI